MRHNMDRRHLAGLLSAVAVLIAWWMTASSGLPLQTRVALVGILLTVIWWAVALIPPAYTSMSMLLFFAVTGIGAPEDLFGFWITPMAWLMIGAYLIARGVTRVGLARRIAVRLVSRYVRSYTQLVIMIYGLNLILAPLVPLPFPRAFLIMALVWEILRESGVDAEGRASLGFCVFMGSVPASMLFLTSEAILNPVTASLAGGISWLEWATLMSVPALAAAGLMLGAHLLVFQPVPLNIDPAAWRKKARDMGRLSADEMRVLAWIALALLLWITDSLHGIHPGWVALGVGVGMALPGIGGILGESDLSEGVDWSALLFATAALAIGAISEATGLTEWLLQFLLPAQISEHYLFILGYVAAAGFVLHLFVGSVLATLSMLVPPLMAMAAQFDVPSFAPALLIYSTANMGIALPFHNLMILVGVGETGAFSERETLRFFPAQAAITLITVLIQISWWVLIGRL